MTQIRNKTQLIQNGRTSNTQRARALALNSLECALNAAEPKTLLLSKVKLENSHLHAGELVFDLKKFSHVYVVGGGKAGTAMAVALEQILGTQLTGGTVNVLRGSKQKTKKIDLTEASHPLPDQAGVEGTRRIMEIAEKAQADDLLICLLSGGGSSILPLPRKGVTLAAKRKITRTLLKSGASIGEINVIRKHLSGFKGGWLAKKAYPATVLTLVLSDVVGDPRESIASGPTTPDPSTFADAQRILQKYGLWENVPASVRRVLSEGARGLIEETPKPGDPTFQNVFNVVVGNNKVALDAAREYLKSEGLSTLLLPDQLGGEAKKNGETLALFACKLALSEPSIKPVGVVVGGETTVTVTGKGLGGRNQELVLSAALHLASAESCAVASIGTDGVDGPTDAAGAVADNFTLSRAADFKLDPQKFLENNDSHHFFSRLGDLIFTGTTGTNVNDISVFVVL